MGADFRWMMCGLDDAVSEIVESAFNFSANYASLDARQQTVYALFREAPEALLPTWVVGSDGSGHIEAVHARDFSSLFALARYQALPKAIGLGGKDMLTFLSGETSPVEVLFYSLGAVQAERLPGFFGNMLVRREQLSQAIAQVNDVLRHVDEASWDRARCIVSICTAGKASRSHDAEIRDIFQALPAAMEIALSRSRHFVSSAFWLG